MRDKDDATTIDCPEHGKSRYSVICVHLRTERGLVFFAAPPCEHGPAQAWCNACDQVMQAQQGWNDAADEHAKWKLFCSDCYRKALQAHTFRQYVHGSDDDCDWSGLGTPTG